MMLAQQQQHHLNTTTNTNQHQQQQRWRHIMTQGRPHIRGVVLTTPAAAASDAAAAAPAQQQHREPIKCDVAIVGAGPAGLAAAAALQRADPSLKLHVFERSPMSAKGAAVLVGVNGLLALEAVDPQLLQGLLAKAIKLEGSDRYNYETGEWIEFMAMSNDKFKEQYGYSNALLGWSDITAALREALPPSALTTRCPVGGFRQQPDGTIQLLAPAPAAPAAGEEGSAEAGAPEAAACVCECRALVAADGWFSAIRQQLLADGPPAFKDTVVFRARIRRPAGMPEQKTKWWVPPGGPNAADPLAVLIPVPGGDLVWQCHAPLSLMQSKGLTFDVTGAGEAASSHASADTHSASSGSSSGPGGSSSSGSVKERCLAAFGGFPADFLDVVKSTPEEAITEHGLYQRTPEQIEAVGDTWGSGMVTLVGDAAHCAYVDGTGLALSLEDAAVLGWHVQQGGLTEAALRAFERERTPRVRAVFGLAAAQAAKMKAGIPQRQLLDERAALLYGQAKFKPLQPQQQQQPGGGDAAAAPAEGVPAAAAART